jgi:hypothetical protein
MKQVVFDLPINDRQRYHLDQLLQDLVKETGLNPTSQEFRQRVRDLWGIAAATPNDNINTSPYTWILKFIDWEQAHKFCQTQYFMNKNWERPICINPGCGKPAVPMRGRVGEESVRYRVFCANCHKNSYADYPLSPGVSRFKTGICRNRDGHLGFTCAVDYEREPWAQGLTQVDHKDGCSTNNDPNNLDELCPLCHTRKGILQGDHNRYK